MANSLFSSGRKESSSFLRYRTLSTRRAQATPASRGVGRRPVVISRMLGLTFSGEGYAYIAFQSVARNYV